MKKKENRETGNNFPSAQGAGEKEPEAIIETVALGWGEEEIKRSGNKHPRDSYFFVHRPGL